MKNRFTLLFALGLVLFVVIGCSFSGLTGSDEKSTSGSGDSSSTSDKKTEAEPSGEIVEVGIKECDELATYINDNAEEIKDEGFVVRGIIEYVKQSIFSNLRDSVEKMTDEEKVKTGENCKKALENLKKQMQK